MSTRELRRAEVLGRVKGQTLRLVDAAKMLELSYRQAKRLWQRYRDEGAKGLQHRSAGRSSNRAKLEKFRRKVLQLIREKYSGTEQERFVTSVNGQTFLVKTAAGEVAVALHLRCVVDWADRNNCQALARLRTARAVG
jgi:molybdenum-dependent DNA-binding transcriptional regulator ModE